ncbi:MAG: ABC transporter substrate-binding protein [Burkholderiaceae bacterium]
MGSISWRVALRKLRVGAVSRNYFNLPLWIGLSQNLFRKENLDVSVELFEPIDAVWRGLKEGQLDLALGVTEQIILDQENGGDLEIVAGNVNRLPFSFISGKHIRSFENLRGKTIGVSSIESGSSSLVMKIMASHGLHYPNDYQLKAVGPILARWEGLQTGEIDAGLQGAPLNYMAVDQGFNSLCEPRDQFPWFQFTSLNVSNRWAQNNSEDLIAFLRAFLVAHEWFYQNQEGVRNIAMRETGIASDYADRAWVEYTQAEIFPRDGAANPLAVQALIDTSALIRSLPSRADKPGQDYINSRWIDQAGRDLGRH